MSLAADLMYCRSIFPSGWLGVPTVMKEISDAIIASFVSVVKRRVPLAKTCLSIFSKPGSKMGTAPLLIILIFSWSMSTPKVLNPFCAKQTAVQSPT